MSTVATEGRTLLRGRAASVFAMVCALMVACAIALCASPATAQAATTDDGWTYSTSDAGAVITGYSGTSLTPTVPATLDTQPVTGVVVNEGAGAPAITSIDLSAVASTLQRLKVYGCALTSLDLSGCSGLTYVDVRENNLSSLVLGSQTQLTQLFCSGNQLRSLDVSGCTALTTLRCDNNALTALDLVRCSALEYLDCHNNQLTALSVDANINLTDCFCYNNSITTGLYALTQRFGTEQNVVLPQNGVEPVSLEGAQVVLSSASATYTGSPIEPAVTVSLNGETLVAGTDYTVTYANNTEVGTATVTVTGIGNYTGTASATFAITAAVQPPEPAGSVPMYRLYNPYSGEHFYTASTVERDSLVGIGWNGEGIGWYAPETSNTPVYRLYNPYTGDHHFTTSAAERDACVAAGWNDEGLGWYSDDAKGTPVYRQYNPYAQSFYHNYTASAAERDHLVSLGWQDEGIGWYGVAQ